MNIIDINSSLGFWPIQRFSHQTIESLDEHYEALGIGEVWLSAVESILYPEPDTFDHLLFERLSRFPRFHAIKTVNPLLTGWQDRIEQTRKRHAIRALKVFPGYHGYSLLEGSGASLCRYADEHRLPLLIQIRVNDERNQPVAMQVPPVPVLEIAELSRKFPATRMGALCAYPKELRILSEGSGNLRVDLSFLDGEGMMERAVREMGAERIVFGSHAPFLHATPSHMKLQYSQLPQSLTCSIAAGNVWS